MKGYDSEKDAFVGHDHAQNEDQIQSAWI